MTVKQAAKLLGCSAWQICELYQMDFLRGYKPGAKSIRRDGRASNARLRLDTESVLRYKAQQEERARWEKRHLAD